MVKHWLKWCNSCCWSCAVLRLSSGQVLLIQPSYCMHIKAPFERLPREPRTVVCYSAPCKAVYHGFIFAGETDDYGDASQTGSCPQSPHSVCNKCVYVCVLLPMMPNVWLIATLGMCLTDSCLRLAKRLRLPSCCCCCCCYCCTVWPADAARGGTVHLATEAHRGAMLPCSPEASASTHVAAHILALTDAYRCFKYLHIKARG